MTPQHRNFDNDAKTWDANPTRLKLAEDVVRTMTHRIPFGPALDVLDFGCGTGLLTLALAPLVKSVTGVDTSRNMLDVLKEKAAHLNLSNVRTRLLNPGDPLTGSFDIIVSSMTFHHVEDIDGLLASCFTALKPGGRLAVADLDSEGGEFHENPKGVFHQGFDREALRDAFQKAGLNQIADTTAATVTKPAANGLPRAFSIFLITGRKRE